MKIGSVAFFKKLIISVFILIITVPLVCAVVFGVMYAGQKNRADRLEAAQLLVGDDEAPLLTQGDADAQPLGDVATPLAPPQTQQPAYSPDASFDYQTRYPHLYAARPQPVAAEGRVCYLTFDDGPSQNTLQVMQTLARHDIKATFFVTGANSLANPDILRAAVAAGHTVGVHTFSHEYGEIYASVDSFLDDFEKMYTTILDITGVAPSVFRFAGGSLNVHNQFLYNEIVAEMVRRGFVFYDWNVAASDAVAGGISRQQVVNNVLNGVGDAERIVVLMHDRQDNVSTAAALDQVIEGLAEMGFSFAPLTAEVPPVTFYYSA